MESRDYDELLQWVRSNRRVDGEVFVIDGATGSGKTFLAMRLARDLQGIRLSTDCYLIAGSSGPYVGRLASDFLEDDLARLRFLFPVVFVEGLCVRRALESLQIRWAHTIYVKQLGSSGLWHFLFHLEDFVGGRSLPEDLEEPFRSDYEYHQQCSPHDDAHFTFVRVAD